MMLTKINPLSTILDEYDAIIFDLWGVLVEGAHLYDGVADAINALMKQKQVRFVSNSPRLKVDIAAIIRNFGIDVTPAQFFTSGQMVHDLLHNKQNVYYIANGNDYTILPTESTSTSDINKASIILLAAQLDEGENLQTFDPIFREAIDLGIKCICANPDTIIPNRGKIRYCPGYFAKSYEDMGGQVIYIGKPGVNIFNDAIDSLMPKPSLNRIIMVGDTLEIDILGANKAGIHSGLVMTGNTARITSEYDGLDEKLKYLEKKCEAYRIEPNMILDLIS
jgi:HAD superfamily hydrolase (TIGR01459 family)